MIKINEIDTVEGLSSAQVDKIWGDNVVLCRLANKRRSMITTPPPQSNFRVHAILLVTSTSGRYMFEGTNGEPGNYMGAAICAERAAALKTRFVEGAQVAKVVLVSDCPDPISPCALCREYLISVGTRNTQIVMGNGNGDIITQCSLGELFPFPSVYRFQSRDSLVKGGLMFSSKMKKVKSAVDADMLRLYKLAFSCVKFESVVNVHGNVHPLNLAAACLYSTGETDVAVQLKSLSFGCSLDPVSQLVGAMVRRVTLGHRVPQSVEDARNRKVQSRIRNRSQERGMGMITRGGHQYNHKRHICTHCGSGRSIRLDDDDDDHHDDGGGDDDRKTGNRPPPPTRVIDNRPLLLLAKGHVALSAEEEEEDKGSDSSPAAATSSSSSSSSVVNGKVAVGSPPASATKSSGGDYGSGMSRPRPQSPTPTGTPSSLLSLALDGMDRDDAKNENVHPDHPLVGGHSDLGSRCDHDHDHSTERDEDGHAAARNNSSNNNNTHKHGPAAALARHPILQNGTVGGGSATSGVSSEADFKESSTSRPGTKDKGGHMFAVKEMYGALTRPPTTSTSSPSHPHLGDYRPDGYDAMGHDVNGGDDYDDDDDDSYGGPSSAAAAVTVLAVVMVDQFGVAHAPPGRARALLSEHGFSDVLIVVHNERGGVETVTAADLLPSPAGVGRSLQVDDFPVIEEHQLFA